MANLGVIGSGVMGSGIGQVAATAGWHVVFRDVSPEVARRGIDGVKANLSRLVDKGKLSAVERDAILEKLRVADTPTDFADCELVVEAVAEKLDIKVAVLAAVVPFLSPDAILASNTSSLSITTLGRAVGAARRTVGMHFFNPAPLMPLVEVIHGDDSELAVVERAAEIARSWGKTVVRAKDTPGFIVNRVARGFYLEALRLLDEGAADIPYIDQTIRELGGFRMGPFELMDLIGVDVNYGVSVSVWEQLGKPARLTPHRLQAERVEQGCLGRKTKRGFYDYESEPPTPLVAVPRREVELTLEEIETLAAFAEHGAQRVGTVEERWVFARILGAILNEAALALDEGVATSEDIDTAMRLGTNYPRGPLEWIGTIGKRRCMETLAAMTARTKDDRYRPAKYFKEP